MDSIQDHVSVSSTREQVKDKPREEREREKTASKRRRRRELTIGRMIPDADLNMAMD